MKKLLLAALLLAPAILSGGCATPAYSGGENFQMTMRNIDFDLKQAVDDSDNFWLLRPPSRMTIWNLR